MESSSIVVDQHSKGGSRQLLQLLAFNPINTCPQQEHYERLIKMSKEKRRRLPITPKCITLKTIDPETLSFLLPTFFPALKLDIHTSKATICLTVLINPEPQDFRTGSASC
uniref:Uncharacterized protein n=1 Tax=Ditylenchus dipsaci TaxID=166011 RepID=A0A915EJD2_9BILA